MSRADPRTDYETASPNRPNYLKDRVRPTARCLPTARQTGVDNRSPANCDCHQLAKRVLRWPLWGVALSGVSSALLWEHRGEILKEHTTLLLFGLLALPLIGGILTPQRPAYTVVVFAVGSFPPLNDIPPVPIGIWPLQWISTALTNDSHSTAWTTVVAHLPFVLAVTALCLAAMSIAFMPLIYVGWRLRCWQRG